MPRIRTVKPEFFLSEEFWSVSETARLLYIGLSIHADDRGRFRANVALVTSAVFPLGAPVTPVPFAMGELERVGRIVIATGKDGVLYGLLPHFLREQRIDRPSSITIAGDTSFPEHSEHFRRVLDEPSTSPRRALPAGLGGGVGSVDVEQEQEGSPEGNIAGAPAPAPPLVLEAKPTPERKKRAVRERVLSPISVELTATISTATNVTYPPACWDVLETALARGDLTPDDARVVVAYASTETFWRTTNKLDPSSLFRAKTWPALLAKGKASKAPTPVPARDGTERRVYTREDALGIE